MNKDQWTVLGLVLVLLGLEVIRSQAVKSFLGGFFAQFHGTGAPSNSTNVGGTGSSAVNVPTGNSTVNKIRGLPGNQ